MFDVYKIRKDFPMLDDKNGTRKVPIYLDNAATTFKPYSVIEATSKYYLEDSANAHRGDYDLAFKVDTEVDRCRANVAKFLNANKTEIVFTSGCSMSMNLVAYGYGVKHLKAGDEILLTEAEHASNVLPWFKVAEMTGAIIKYIPLTQEGRLTSENLKKVMT